MSKTTVSLFPFEIHLGLCSTYSKSCHVVEIIACGKILFFYITHVCLFKILIRGYNRFVSMLAKKQHLFTLNDSVLT